MDHETLLAGLRAAAEPTRLRLLALCAQAELSVSELVQILRQSQPRVSRHLRVLCEAGLLDRSREGTSAFYRLARRGEGAELARILADLVAKNGGRAGTLDSERLAAVRKARAEAAAAYFRINAPRWDQIRSLHVDEAVVECRLRELLAAEPLGDVLDIGTGTGRVLEILGPIARTGTGIDLSREMLALARARLERAGLANCTLRQGDMYDLPWPADSFDVVTIHQVLHYAEAPAAVIREAARVLRARGRLVVVDFAPHELERLRAEHAHRHLGFSDQDVRGWCRAAGLDPGEALRLPGKPLTVTIWSARRAAHAATSARALRRRAGARAALGGGSQP